MAELVRVLWAYSTHNRCWDQEDGFWDVMHRRVVSISWFILSAWPFDWGWYPDVKLAVAPKRLQNSRQNTEENWGPLSETTSTGIP